MSVRYFAMFCHLVSWLASLVSVVSSPFPEHNTKAKHEEMEHCYTVCSLCAQPHIQCTRLRLFVCSQLVKVLQLKPAMY